MKPKLNTYTPSPPYWCCADSNIQTERATRFPRTDSRWRFCISTDNGSYYINTSGIWACPEAIGQIKADSVYTFTVDGWYESSFWGAYPYIVKVHK